MTVRWKDKTALDPSESEGNIVTPVTLPGGADRKATWFQFRQFLLNETGADEFVDISNAWLRAFLGTSSLPFARASIEVYSQAEINALFDSLAPIATTGNVVDLIGPAFLETFLQTTTQADARTAIGAQASDTDLTTIAGLTATTDSFMQAKSGAWAARTIVQVKTDLGLSNGFVSFSGPASTGKTFTLPNANATILTDNALVTGAQGGTGVNNSGKTFTIGGNFTTSGAFACTLTVTAATNVTLPTTGTLPAIATSGTPADLAATAALGSSTFAAKADHVHKAPGATNGTTVLGTSYTLTSALTVQTTTLNFTAPDIGTYRITVDAAITTTAGYVYLVGYIYNDSTLTNAGPSLFTLDDSTFYGVKSMTAIIVTTAANQVISFRMQRGSASGAAQLAATYSRMIWDKIA